MTRLTSEASLYGCVCQKILLKQEGTSWDFKKQWYSDNTELLYDIICMSNMVKHEDGLIIIGIDEERDYSVCGVEQCTSRKKTQDIVCLLRDKKFAFGTRPVVYVKTITIEEHEVDVIVVEDSTNTPFYLTERFQSIQPYHIYTRVMDTNTGRDKSADPNVVEALWKKRFGLDQTALQRAMVYLNDINGWDSVDGEQSHFYKYAPEFTLQCEDDERDGYEYYVFGQISSYRKWYRILLYYHQTVIYHTVGISLDGGRYFTAVPEKDAIRPNEINDCIWLSYYVKGTIDYLLHRFYSCFSESSDSRSAEQRFLNAVPIFSSEAEKREFFNYANMRFDRSKLLVKRERYIPAFPRNLPNGQNVLYFEREYQDAIMLMDLLEEYRSDTGK